MIRSKPSLKWFTYLIFILSITVISGCGGGSSESDSPTKENVLSEDENTTPGDETNSDESTDNDSDNDTENTALTVNAGPDQAVLVSSAITLTASASGGEGNYTYKWSQQSGDTVSLSSSNTSQTTFTSPDDEGDLVFMVTVTDSNNQTNTDSITISVSQPEDNIPTANAGVSFTISIGETANISAEHSVDIGGTITSYQWQQINYDTDESISFDNPQSVTQSITPTQVGMVSFELTVTDNDDNTDTDIVHITINEGDNVVPVANANIDQWVHPGNLVTLDGRYSVAVDDGFTYHNWRQVSGEAVEIADESSLKTTFTAPNTTGELIFEIRAGDKTGAIDQDTVSIYVIDEDTEKPTAHAGATVVSTPNQTVELDGSASNDSDGTIIRYEWKQLTGPDVTLLNSRTSKAQFTAPEYSGRMIFELSVFDNEGAGDRQTVNVFINNNNNNLAPVAHAGEDQTVLTDSVVELSSWGSYDDDKSESVQWLWETQADK